MRSFIINEHRCLRFCLTDDVFLCQTLLFRESLEVLLEIILHINASMTIECEVIRSHYCEEGYTVILNLDFSK